MAIESFRHKGLKRLFEDDDARALPARAADKLRKMLLALGQAETIAEIGAMPGWRLHPLKGDLAFRFEDGNVHDLDLMDYH